MHEQNSRKRGKGECQLQRGHQFRLVSGQGKQQEWMPKLERCWPDLRNPVILCVLAFQGSEHGTMFDSNTMGGPCLLVEFPKPHSCWGDRGWSLPITTAVCWGRVPHPQSHGTRSTPYPGKGFDVSLRCFLYSGERPPG